MKSIVEYGKPEYSSEPLIVSVFVGVLYFVATKNLSFFLLKVKQDHFSGVKRFLISTEN